MTNNLIIRSIEEHFINWKDGDDSEGDLRKWSALVDIDTLHCALVDVAGYIADIEDQESTNISYVFCHLSTTDAFTITATNAHDEMTISIATIGGTYL